MEKRVISVFLCFCLVMGAICLRLYTVTTQVDTASYISSHYKKVTLDTLRLPINDVNGKPLVNKKTENFIVAKPDKKSISLLREMLDNDDFNKITSSLLQGSAGYACVGDKYYPLCQSYITLRKNIRYSDLSAVHLIGYVNSDGNGVSGLERCFDSFLKTEVPLYAGFLCDVNGNIISGAEIETDPVYVSHKGGVTTTIDIDIQSIAEQALLNSGITNGTVMVSDAQTGEIKAVASLPVYDPDNVEVYLKDKESPLTNRALSAYAVGSVFKVVVAACALENGIDKTFSYNCNGEITVDGNVFHCNNSNAHGLLDMEAALAASCNCYFIQLSKQLGGDAISETASLFDFGRSIEIAENLFSSKGRLPTKEELKIPGNLANFSFGQGKFTATPVQMINVFNAIANNGRYTSAYCVRNATDTAGDIVYEYKPKAPVYAISEETANLLSQMLITAVNEGTAHNAYTEDFVSAGKTATAQTGIYDAEGKEKLCTWFGGFFSADDFRYSVIVVSENGTTGGEDCAPVFKEIAEKINLQNKQKTLAK